jgi:hypothetical protein
MAMIEDGTAKDGKLFGDAKNVQGKPSISKSSNKEDLPTSMLKFRAL